MPTTASAPTVSSDKLRGKYCAGSDSFPDSYVYCPNQLCCPLPARLLESQPRCSWSGDSCYRPVLGEVYLVALYLALFLAWGGAWSCYLRSARRARASGGSGQVNDQRAYASLSEVVPVS